MAKEVETLRVCESCREAMGKLFQVLREDGTIFIVAAMGKYIFKTFMQCKDKITAT